MKTQHDASDSKYPTSLESNLADVRLDEHIQYGFNGENNKSILAYFSWWLNKSRYAEVSKYNYLPDARKRDVAQVLLSRLKNKIHETGQP